MNEQNIKSDFWETAHQTNNKLWLTGSDPNFVLKIYKTDIPSYKSVLDLGVGFGLFSELLYENHNRVFAVDISESALEKVNVYAQTYLTQNLVEIEKVDLAYCHLVLQHCSDEMVQFIFNNIQLKEDGLFYFQFAFLQSRSNPTDSLSNLMNEGLLYFRDLDEVLYMMQKANLLPVEIVKPIYFIAEDVIGWYLIKAKRSVHKWQFVSYNKMKSIDYLLNRREYVLNLSDNEYLISSFNSANVVGSGNPEQLIGTKTNLSLPLIKETSKVLLAQAHNLVVKQSFDVAAKTLNKILENDPNNLEAITLLAKINYNNYSFDNALLLTKRTLDIDSYNELLHSNKEIVIQAINNSSPDNYFQLSELAVYYEVNLDKIDRINGLELLSELPTSRIYKAEINNSEYILKVIDANPNMLFSQVLNSYKNSIVYNDIPELVRVLDYRIVNGGNQFEILMEYLKNFVPVQSIDDDRKESLAQETLRIIKKILSKGIIPVDCGLANFFTDGTKVKLLDLDFMLEWREISYFNIKWFISRLEEIRKWCPSIIAKVDLLIDEVKKQSQYYFSNFPFNPLTQKYIDESGLIIEKNGDLNSAVDILYKALNITPNSAGVYNNLAVAFWYLDDPARTIELMKIAVELDPANKDFVANYLDILISLEKYEEVERYRKANNSIKVTTKVLSCSTVDEKLQKKIDLYSYPANYAYDVMTLKPKGALETRVDYFLNHTPDLFEPCENFLSIGSSLGYMLFIHANKARKCVGIEPDPKANEIVKEVAALRDIKNISLHQCNFKDFTTSDKYDLIWMGNVFQYMYVDFGWKVAEELAKISNGKCIIEAPFEGEYLKQQANLNANWKNEILMNEYKFVQFKSKMEPYFNIISVNPSGTDPDNRLLVQMERRK